MFRKVPWTSEAEGRMQHAAGASCLPYLRAEVIGGRSDLYHCKDGDDEAYLITRVDLNPTELVVCYFEGSGMVKFGRAIVASARTKGIAVRAHTEQLSVERLLRRCGLYCTEHVLRSRIGSVQ